MDNFFRQFGNKLEITNSCDLKEKWSCIDWRLTEQKTSEDWEKYSLVVYLFELDRRNMLSFPLEIEKPLQRHLSPDIILRGGDGITTGLEQTLATSPNYQRADKYTGKSQRGNKVIELSYFKSKEDHRSRNKIMNAIHEPNERFNGPGYDGDEVEGEWADYVTKRILKKLEKLNRGHYLPCDRYELLISDDTPNVVSDWGIAFDSLGNQLAGELSDKQFPGKFDCISIAYQKRLFYDIIAMLKKREHP